MMELANKLINLEMYPYFYVSHVIICCMHVKSDFDRKEREAHLFSRKHPLACWLSCMFSIFSGTIFSNFLMNEPIVLAFKNTEEVLVATGAWYAIFYSPFDLSFKICRFLPIKVALEAMKEVLRFNKIHQGIMHTRNIYPGSYFVMVLIGTVRGNGGRLLRPFESLLRGIWRPSEIESIKPSPATKASILASIVFIIKLETDLIASPPEVVYLAITAAFVLLAVLSEIFGIHDPLGPLEDLMCEIFFKSIDDAIERWRSRSASRQKVETSKAKKKSANTALGAGARGSKTKGD